MSPTLQVRYAGPRRQAWKLTNGLKAGTLWQKGLQGHGEVSEPRLWIYSSRKSHKSSSRVLVFNGFHRIEYRKYRKLNHWIFCSKSAIWSIAQIPLPILEACWITQRECVCHEPVRSLVLGMFRPKSFHGSQAGFELAWIHEMNLCPLDPIRIIPKLIWCLEMSWVSEHPRHFFPLLCFFLHELFLSLPVCRRSFEPQNPTVTIAIIYIYIYVCNVM